MTALDHPAAEATLAPYQAAFLDWLACARAGRAERAVRALATVGTDLPGRVAAAAAAGHVLDFDDTLAEGVAHVSAACAPAALLVAARCGCTTGEMLAAYAEGFEAMAAVAAASHPALYDGGWHPTAVCGPVGAAVAAAHLLDLGPEQRETALAAALLRAGGTRGAFGSEGKAIQVGMAAAAGVQGALLAQAGAVVDARAIHGPLGFEGVLHATVPASWGAPVHRHIAHNWVKLHPSCLGTHAPIEAAGEIRRDRSGDGPLEVVVHPVARQAAHLDAVDTGLEAKFSIPYCVAYTLCYGPPGVGDFAALDPAVSARAAAIAITTDPAQPPFGAVVRAGARELARVPSPTGSPERAATPADLEAKLRDLDGTSLLGVLDDLSAPARDVLDAVELA